jgi:hypothetical protein
MGAVAAPRHKDWGCVPVTFMAIAVSSVEYGEADAFAAHLAAVV